MTNDLRAQRLPLLIVLTVSFLSTVGMALVFPVLPFVVGRYVSDAGSTAFWVGVLEAGYAACAFVAAPFLGALSDRIGRRPVLIASLLGSAVGWVLFGRLLMSGVGVVDIVVQGGLLAILLRIMGERGAVIGGLLGQAVSCLLIVGVASFLPASWLFVTGALLFAMTQGATGAVLQGMLSKAVGDDEQGWLAGAMSAIGSAVQMVGPLLAGLLYQRVAPAAPYVLVVVVMFLAAVVVQRLTITAPERQSVVVPVA